MIAIVLIVTIFVSLYFVKSGKFTDALLKSHANSDMMHAFEYYKQNSTFTGYKTESRVPIISISPDGKEAAVFACTLSTGNCACDDSSIYPGEVVEVPESWAKSGKTSCK